MLAVRLATARWIWVYRSGVAKCLLMDDVSAKHHQQLLEYRTYTRNSTPPFRSVSSRNPPRTNLKGIKGLGLLLHRAFAAAATTTNFQLFGPRFTQGENYIQTTIYICYIVHPPYHRPAIASMVRYRSFPANDFPEVILSNRFQRSKFTSRCSWLLRVS